MFLYIDYFKKDNYMHNDNNYNNDTKKEYNFQKEKVTEDVFNNEDDDWEDDQNDFEEPKKIIKDNISDKNIQPVDIRKIGVKNFNKKEKCETTYLGNGLSDDITLCDNLICTKCDCKVNIFKNQMWDTDVNYLFFRNNFATPNKLKEKLIESYGTYAYSCQCFWKNISEDYVPAHNVSNWICGGHFI